MPLPAFVDGKLDINLKAGSRMKPVTITEEGKRLFFKFGFSKPLMEEIKAMEGHRYHGYDETNPRKVWSVVNSQRNHFQIMYLAHPGANDPLNPYFHYDKPLIDYTSPTRDPYKHQLQMISQGLTRHYTELAAEMGTGKTLAAIEIMENSGATDWWWVGPKSALVSVKLEFRKWNAKIIPRYFTYEGFQKEIAEWQDGKAAPQGVIFDEASRLKNPKAKRTQAAMHLANCIREEWDMEGYVILMSGSPAPKSPVDWWSQLETVQPGFLREGTVEKFRQRLAIIEMRESFGGGGAFPNLVTWKDDEKKCDICGLHRDGETHVDEIVEGIDVFQASNSCHIFKPSVNEVALLYRRMQGAVQVIFKKDCLELPDKIYREIVLKPTQTILNAARTIENTAPSTIQALTLLRELSDGFQYQEQDSPTLIKCDRCFGTGRCNQLTAKDYDASPEEFERGVKFDDELGEWTDTRLDIISEEVDCSWCEGRGERHTTQRVAIQFPSPKEDALKELLDEYDDVGRVVIFGGFTGTLDRVTTIISNAKWHFIRVDGRGWASDLPGTPEELLLKFQTGQDKHFRIAFIGHPGSAGMGLTLTASPVEIYYSNDFNAESRIQSEDRCHRPGMDVNRGCTIIDFILLPSDKVVLNNLKLKRRLQDITMGEMKTAVIEAKSFMDRML